MRQSGLGSGHSSSSRYEKKVIRVGVLVIQYVMSIDTSGKIRTFSGRLGGEYTV
jgi:hypothetical protein